MRARVISVGEVGGGYENASEGDERSLTAIESLKTKQHTTLRRVLGQPSAGERRWSATLVAKLVSLFAVKFDTGVNTLQ